MMCGAQLISPKDAELGMCTLCLKVAKQSAKKQIKGRKSRKDTKKRFRLKVNPIFVRAK